MTSFQAAIIGVIQGLTEFLPVSSTAHIRVVPALLNWDDPGAPFTAVIQTGTLVAALIYFRQDIWAITLGTLRGLREGKPLGTLEARLGWMIAVGTIPVVVFGLLFKKRIEEDWRSLFVISAAAAIPALALALAEWLVHRRTLRGAKQKGLADIGWLDALVVGFAQAVALIPGASRSGVTITGGLFVGMNRPTAARYSFLLSLPAVFGAAVKELYDERRDLLASQESVANLVLATVIAGVIGYASIAFLLRYLKTHTTWVFIVYRLVLAGLLLVLLLNHVIPARPPENPSAEETPLAAWRAHAASRNLPDAAAVFRGLNHHGFSLASRFAPSYHRACLPALTPRGVASCDGVSARPVC
jgi:undecaprenyl-diphosphatase